MIKKYIYTRHWKHLSFPTSVPTVKKVGYVRAAPSGVLEKQCPEGTAGSFKAGIGNFILSRLAV